MKYFINKKVEDCYGETLDFIIPSLKELTYYVVDIKFRKSNPIHRCIMATGFKYEGNNPKSCFLFSRNYGCESKEIDIDKIYYFKIISEINEMKSNL